MSYGVGSVSLLYTVFGRLFSIHVMVFLAPYRHLVLFYSGCVVLTGCLPERALLEKYDLVIFDDFSQAIRLRNDRYHRYIGTSV